MDLIGIMQKREKSHWSMKYIPICNKRFNIVENNSDTSEHKLTYTSYFSRVDWLYATDENPSFISLLLFVDGKVCDP